MKTLSKHMKWTLAVLAALAVVAAGSHSKHDVLILQGQSFYWTVSGAGPAQYQWAGVAVYNAESSAGAPQYTMPTANYPQYYSTNRMAQEIANALDQGFVIKAVNGDNWNQTVTLVREK